jgi:hypothetical protein
LFPNNYLDDSELDEIERLSQLLASFESLLESNSLNENAILKFIEVNRAYFIVASILKRYYHFGHHDAFLFREFQLGNSYKADFLLIGRSSGGWEFVFVELESPSDATLKEGDLGSAFRKGQKQVDDWKAWLEAHFQSLRETLEKHKRDNVDLPREFCVLDTSRIHYAIVAGRRTDFNERTYRIRRERRNDQRLLLLHYDNLVDSSREIIGAATY